jgi:cytochrome P450
MAQDAAPDPPGPGTFETLAGAARFRRNPLGEAFAIIRRHGDLVCSRFGPWRFYSIFRPDHVQHVLHDNHQNYVKGDLIERTKILIGEGLFSSEGDTWRRQRRIIQPAFDRRRIAALVPLITDSTAAMLDEWAQHADRGTPLDLTTAMTGLTLDIIGRAFFGVDLRGEGAEIGDALRVALAYVNRRTMSLFPMPTGLPFPRNVRFRRALRTLDDAVSRIIQERRRVEQPDAGDLLSLLLVARDPDTGEGMSDAELRDQVMTFVLAGHETTALALAWALCLLALHPEIDARLRQEVRSVLAGRAPTLDDLARLPYARMVLDETLRLYPPVWAFPREAIADDRIDGYRIRAGSTVAIIPYITHRHPAVWSEPARFDPERFSPTAAGTRPRYAYLPFGGGPRQCIGSEFALMEAQLALAMIVHDYRVVVAVDGPIEPEVSLTLRPRGGLRATLHRVAPAQ